MSRVLGYGAAGCLLAAIWFNGMHVAVKLTLTGLLFALVAALTLDPGPARPTSWRRLS